MQPGLRTTGLQDTEQIPLHGFQELHVTYTILKYLLSICYMPNTLLAQKLSKNNF